MYLKGELYKKMNHMKTIKSILLLAAILLTTGLSAQTKAFKVEVIGKGNPVLLFPGFTCPGEVWEETVKELSKDYECHIFTFAGFGDVAPIEKPWLPKIKESVENYVLKHKLENPSIIGHSLGGVLGLWLTTEQNSNYKKLIVVDALPASGALMMPNYKSENMVYDSPYNKQQLAMNEDDFKKMALGMVPYMMLSKEKQATVVEWMVQSDRETYVYGYTDFLRLDLREDVAKIKTPVTILAATKPYGKDVVQKNYVEQYKNLSSYTIIYAEDSAHFIMFDQPKWFVNQVREQLK